MFDCQPAAADDRLAAEDFRVHGDPFQQFIRVCHNSKVYPSAPELTRACLRQSIMLRALLAAAFGAMLAVSCSDPGYEVREAYLVGSKVQVDVQYGIGTRRSVGILLVEGFPVPADTAGWRVGAVQLGEDSITFQGIAYPLHYALADPEWVKPLPSSFRPVSDLEQQCTGELTADLIMAIKAGHITCVLITEGVGSANHPVTELQFWPRRVTVGPPP